MYGLISISPYINNNLKGEDGERAKPRRLRCRRSNGRGGPPGWAP